jgi:uncharacterized membrane protein (UPF0127 family)
VIFVILRAPEIIDAKEIVGFNRDPQNYNVKLQIIDGDKQVAGFLVAVADTNHKRMYGLMNLKNLDKNHGMLFEFPNNEIVAMWMKNTKIPLDMIFIDEDDKIVSITENAVPHSLDIISSHEKVDKALEINAGLVKKFGIKIGQQVDY